MSRFFRCTKCQHTGNCMIVVENDTEGFPADEPVNCPYEMDGGAEWVE